MSQVLEGMKKDLTKMRRRKEKRDLKESQLAPLRLGPILEGDSGENSSEGGALEELWEELEPEESRSGVSGGRSSMAYARAFAYRRVDRYGRNAQGKRNTMRARC